MQHVQWASGEITVGRFKVNIQEVRRQRDMMLAATDKFLNIPDWPHVEGERDAWIAYRESLRNITTLAEFSNENDFWPLPPRRYGPLSDKSSINLPVDYQDQYS